MILLNFEVIGEMDLNIRPISKEEPMEVTAKPARFQNENIEPKKQAESMKPNPPQAKSFYNNKDSPVAKPVVTPLGGSGASANNSRRPPPSRAPPAP